MTPTSWSAGSIVPPLKKRIKKVLAPAARNALPAVTRLAGHGTLVNRGAISDAAFIYAYRALEQEFPEANSDGNGSGDTPPTKAAVQLKVNAARKTKSSTAYIDQLAAGASLQESVLAGIRQLAKNGERQKAVAIGHALQQQAGLYETGSAVLGAAILGTSGPLNAWKVFAQIVHTDAAEHAADEFYAAAFGSLGAEAASILDTDIATGRAARWAPSALLHVAQKALARGLTEQARTLIGLAHGLPESTRSSHVDKQLTRLASWLPEGSRRGKIPLGSGDINYGIMGYEQPDLTSRNIGDYIQTVASMGHLVRQRNFSFTGDPSLVDFAYELRATTKSERFVDGPSSTLNLLELNRDGSPYQALPESTWALTFGWFMHDTFNQGYGLPFHPNLRPILISIFVRFPNMLTTEAINYLRKYGPVGCRDWQSVALLRAVGVPAFFSGCMTTTIDTVFRREGEDRRNATIYVDSPRTGTGDSRTQVQTGIRSLSFADNLRLARDWVSHYHLEYNKVVTSRLHCFLPARSVGSQVTFLPKNRSDNRFGGLIDTTDEDFGDIRQGILDKASTMLQTIAAGTPEDAVYDKWRELCGPQMAEADEYLASSQLRELDRGQILNAVSSDSELEIAGTESTTVHVLVDARRGELKRLPALISSILANTNAPVQLWVASDTASDADRANLESMNLSLPICWLHPSSLDLEALGSIQNAATKHEIVLALAAELMAGAERAVFLPAAALVRSDIAQLASQAAANEQVLIARDDQHRGRSSGLELFRRVASRQGTQNRNALDLIFATHRLHEGDFVTFDPNVMVLNLEVARKTNLGGRLVPLILDFGMTFREALNTIVGPDRTVLSEEWNHTPGYESASDPSLVNWRDCTKPWSKLYTPFASEWLGY